MVSYFLRVAQRSCAAERTCGAKCRQFYRISYSVVKSLSVVACFQRFATRMHAQRMECECDLESAGLRWDRVAFSVLHNPRLPCSARPAGIVR